MTQQHVCGGTLHGASIIPARKWHLCCGCGSTILAGNLYINKKQPYGFFNYHYYRYCGHCERSTPEGREAVALLTKLKGTT